MAGLRAHSYVSPNFLFAVGETFGDCVVSVYTCSAARLQLGALHCRRAIDTIAECERTGVWPAYGQGIIELEELSDRELQELEDG